MNQGVGATQPPAATPPASSASGPGLARSGGAMAIGTVFSRATGFVRTAAIVAALGSTGGIADAYNLANTTPNIVYDLLLGGVLSSVVVPLLVRAAREDDDGGAGFTSTLFTLVVAGLGIATIVGELAAPLLMRLYLAGDAPADERALAVTFTRLFLPQLLFYALTALAGALLNTRSRFGAVGAAPIVNNLVVIGVAVAFIVTRGDRPLGTALSSGQTLLLGLGTTLGVVAMMAALLPSLARADVRLRWRWRPREPRLRVAARLGAWVLAYAAVNQIGFIVIAQLASRVKIGRRQGGGFTVYSTAYQLFSLPHAIVAVSVISALMPAISAAAAAGDVARVRSQLSRGLRLSSVLLVPAALGLAALADPVASAAFQHGASDVQGTRLIADTLAVFAVGLPAFSAYQLLLRAFYAQQDSRTPTLINMVVNVINVGTDVALFVALPQHLRVPGLAAGFALSYLVGTLLAVSLLRRPLGGVDGARVARLVIRVTLASLLGAAVARVLADAIRDVGGGGWAIALLATACGLGAGGYCFVKVARRLRVREVIGLVHLLGR